MTKEGIIKKKVKELLEKYDIYPASKVPEILHVGQEISGWFFMPVSLGMGTHGIPDFIGCYKGYFFAVETKSDISKRPTKLQQISLDAINSCGGIAFVVRDQMELDLFEVNVLQRILGNAS